ncbi:MAG: amidohydrolase [Calditrichaeota bacterium]|nr:amidohydrolase [Calditrichota bacterium]
MHTRVGEASWQTALALGITILSLALSTCSRHAKPPDAPVTMIITNARVWTGCETKPWAEAVAVANDRIAAVGSSAEVSRLASASTRVIDAQGKMVVPGFIDCHVHFLEGGFRLSSVQLRDASTPAEFIKRIKEYAEQVGPGVWITGGDWDHALWGGELPTHQWVDSVSTRNPVWVSRLDGHMALANSLAMQAAGVSAKTPDVEGGTIVRDAQGNPTGIFKDNAMALIDRVVPEPDQSQKERALQAAMNYVASQGVTSVHHMGTWDDLALFRRAHAAGKLLTRIYAAVPLATAELLANEVRAHGRGDEWLRIGMVKGFVDGSLGSHTAAFFEPFTDAPGDSGLLVNTPEDLLRWVSQADSAGLQVAIHAIGDRANALLLDIYARVAAQNGQRDRRFRIEHAQHLRPADILRFAQLGVIASMQPYHAIDDGRWAEKVIGSERIKTTYAFRSLIDSGAHVVFGSDWYVAPPSPLLGIYAAVTRRTIDGMNPEGWVPEQKITVEEALRAYTAKAAYASFEEREKGTLEPGKLADFAVLDRDITRIPPEEIAEAQVVMTVVGGKIVFTRE